ncbi:MAG: MFS transporter [Zestosphaera sp.]
MRDRFRWVVLALCVLTNMLVVASQLAVASPSVPILMTVFGISSAVAGLITSVWAVSRVIVSIPAGAIAMRLGTRSALAVGVLISVAGWALSSSAPDFLSVLLSRFIMGFGSGTIATVAPVAISEWFSRGELGTAMGFWASSMTLGLVWEIPLSAWMISNWGWRQAYTVFMFASLLMVVPILVILRRRPPYPLDPPSKLSWHEVLEPLKNHTFLKTCIAIFFGVGLWSVYSTYVVKWCMAKGYGYMEASLLGTVLNAGCIVSQILSGQIADKMLKDGHKSLFIVGTTLTSIATLAFTYTPPGPVTTVIVAALGAGIAPILVTMFSIPISAAKPEQRSLAMGLAGSFIYAAYTLTSPVGYMYDVHGLTAASILTATMGLTGALIMRTSH